MARSSRSPSAPTAHRLGGILRQRDLSPPAAPAAVQLRVTGGSPLRFKKMVKLLGPEPKAGDLVEVRDKEGQPFGWGLYNPRSKVVLRMLERGPLPPDRDWWRAALARAGSLRRDLLALPAQTDAWRVVHAEADGLSGLVVDRFGDLLSVEVFSLAILQRIEALLELLMEQEGCSKFMVRVDERVQKLEGFRASAFGSPELPEQMEIKEGALRFGVDLREGHKTGFFCDQRDNRRLFAERAKGKSVLDLCCYSGGFAVSAAARGAGKVSAVDLDEKAIGVARANARRNKARVQFVHADAFDYLREAAEAGRQWETVVLDPPKLIRSKDEKARGKQKYFDLNRLVAAVVKPGGLLLSCSCSGLMPRDEFESTVFAAVRPYHSQLLARSGAAPDHPVDPAYPESEYLKALWIRIGDERMGE